MSACAHQPDFPATELEEERIPLRSLRTLLGCTRRLLHALAQRLGIRFRFTSDLARDGRLLACVTPREATLLHQAALAEDHLAFLNENARPSAPGSSLRRHGTLRRPGYFYVIQLDPLRDPERLKLGFTTHLRSRLRRHRSTCPDATILRYWPSLSRWEVAAIDAATAGCAEHLANEVYRTQNLPELLAQTETYFRSLPSLPAAHAPAPSSSSSSSSSSSPSPLNAPPSRTSLRTSLPRSGVRPGADHPIRRRR